MGSCIGFTNPTQRIQIASQEACEAKLPFTPPRRSVERLVLMARSTDENLRAVAAGHPKTPLTELVVLSGDESYHVRSWLVRNPALPEYLAWCMASDEDPRIAAYAQMIID